SADGFFGHIPENPEPCGAPIGRNFTICAARVRSGLNIQPVIGWRQAHLCESTTHTPRHRLPMIAAGSAALALSFLLSRTFLPLALSFLLNSINPVWYWRHPSIN